MVFLIRERKRKKERVRECVREGMKRKKIEKNKGRERERWERERERPLFFFNSYLEQLKYNSVTSIKVWQFISIYKNYSLSSYVFLITFCRRKRKNCYYFRYYKLYTLHYLAKDKGRAWREGRPPASQISWGSKKCSKFKKIQNI